MNVRVALILTLVVAAGVWARSLSQPAVATFYFPHGEHLTPVSRRLANTDDARRVSAQALADGAARVDVSAGGSWEPLWRPGSPHTPLRYYASADGLIAIPTTARTARDAIATFLTGPDDRALTGIPGDVRLLKYEFDEKEGLASLDFSYTESVRTLAIEKPDIMRSVLLGLIASLTEYPGVKAVRIDFDGHSRLGFGECSDLLRTPQRRPRLLNDERLLGR